MHLEQWSICDLLLLRIVCDKPEPGVNLDQDIADLSLFPERIHDSYPQEWRAYLRRQMSACAVAKGDLPQTAEELVGNAGHPLCATDLWPGVWERFERLKQGVETAIAVASSDRVSPLQTPLHQWLKEVIK